MARRAAVAAIALVAACGPGTSDSTTQQLTVQVSGHGTVQLTTGQQCKDQCVVTVAKGASVIATASPDEGWTFSGWSGSCAGGSSCQFTVDHDVELDASFALRPTIPNQHVVTAARNGSGTIRSSPPGVDCGATCSASFTDGTTVTLTPEPQSGWRFDSWSGGCGGPGACVVQLATDVTVWATFVKLPPPQHVLSIAVAGSGSGHVGSTPAGIDCGTTCAAAFAEGTMVHLSAQPASGSTFAGWGGACSGKGDCPVMMSGDANVTAKFDGPPPPDECAGLAPGIPGNPKSYQQKPLSSTDEVCERGVADGSGNLALWSTQFFMGFKSDIVFLDSDGKVRAKGSGVATELTAQLIGFEGMDVFPQGGHGFNVVEYGANGTKTASSAGAAHFPILAEDPTGGMMIATDAPAVDAYDSSGKQRWHAQLARTPVALGVDRTGNALALFKASTLHGQWIDRSGHAGAEFDLGDGLAPVPSDSFEVYPRIGSGLFVLRLAGGHTTWLHQLDSLATVAAGAPDYLASRPDTRLHMAHGGKAYAMLPVPAQGDCTQRIEVLAPSGKSCGSAAFTVAPGSCTTNFIDVGYDGTVVQQLPSSMEDRSCAGNECSCTWRWWTGFFR